MPFLGLVYEPWLGKVITYYLCCWPCIKCGLRKEYTKDIIFTPILLTYSVPAMGESRSKRQQRLRREAAAQEGRTLGEEELKDSSQVAVGMELPTAIHDEGGEEDGFGVNPEVIERFIYGKSTGETTCCGVEYQPHICNVCSSRNTLRVHPIGTPLQYKHLAHATCLS